MHELIDTLIKFSSAGVQSAALTKLTADQLWELADAFDAFYPSPYEATMKAANVVADELESRIEKHPGVPGHTHNPHKAGPPENSDARQPGLRHRPRVTAPGAQRRAGSGTPYRWHDMDRQRGMKQ